MLHWLQGARGRDRRRRGRAPAVEAMEGRLLLSADAPGVDPQAVAYQANLAAQRAEMAAHPGDKTDPAQPSGSKAVVDGGKYAVTDAWNGYWLVHSKNVATVGYNYAKVTVAHNTRRVAGAYLSAVLKGDGKAINQISRTNASKQVANDFGRLSNSPGVKYVGDQFSRFGHGVVDQYHKLFGGGHAKKPTPKA